MKRKILVCSVLLIMTSGAITTAAVLQIQAISYENPSLTSELVPDGYPQCDGRFGVACEDITDGFWSMPNYRKYGLSDEQKVNGIPDAFLIVAANYGMLGSSDDSPVDNLTEHAASLWDDVGQYSDSTWKVGVIGCVGGPMDGHMTIILDDLSNKQAIRDHLFLGLSDDQVSFIDSSEFLSFSTPINGVSIDKLVQVHDWVVTAENNGWNEPYDLFIGGAIFDTSPVEGKIRVSINSESSSEAINYLLSKFPEFIEIKLIPGMNFVPAIGSSEDSLGDTRTTSNPPHYGAVIIDKIPPWTPLGFCTSGIAVVGRTTSSIYQTTAGHCGIQGQRFVSEGSGSTYGDITNISQFPFFDIARLYGSTYRPNIFTNTSNTTYGDNITTRSIVGATPLSPNLVYCVSGTVSLSNCTATITTLDTCINVSGQGLSCNVGIFNNSSFQGTLAKEGDSGAPVYMRNTANGRANFKAWVVAVDTGNVHTFAATRYDDDTTSYLNSDALLTS